MSFNPDGVGGGVKQLYIHFNTDMMPLCPIVTKSRCRNEYSVFGFVWFSIT